MGQRSLAGQTLLTASDPALDHRTMPFGWNLPTWTVVWAYEGLPPTQIFRCGQRREV